LTLSPFGCSVEPVNTAVTFLAVTTNRDRLPNGAFRVQTRRVTVLAGPDDDDTTVSLLAAQLVAARVPDGMILSLDLHSAVA
jgi:hypothetical protein